MNFTIGANPAGIPRTGTLTVAGTSFTVSQQAVPCSYFINPTSQSVAAAGGPGPPVSVTAPEGCGWTATSGTPWITNVTSSGAGNGLREFHRRSQYGPLRTGSLTIAGQVFNVTQADGCSFALIPPGGITVTRAAGSYPVVINASNQACSWTASVTSDFPGGGLFLTGASSGTGTGATAFAVSANLDPLQRVGTLSIAGQAFEVTQARGMP